MKHFVWMSTGIPLLFAVSAATCLRRCAAQHTLEARDALSGGSLDGWTWTWGGPRTVSQGEKPGQGLCLSAPSLGSVPCTASEAANGQCATAVRDVPSDFVSIALKQTNVQQQIGLHTAHTCSDRELWEFVFACEVNGAIYCGRGPGWKVAECGATAKIGDTIQLRRIGDSVSYELCPAPGGPCKVQHTETVAPTTPKLYAHVGIHNAAIAAEVCHLQPMEGSSWGWSFLLGVGLVMATYLGGGAYVGRQNGTGMGASAALQRHPHVAKWREFASLVHDGVSYGRAYVRGQKADGHAVTATRASYQPVQKHASLNRKEKVSKSKDSRRKSDDMNPSPTLARSSNDVDGSLHVGSVEDPEVAGAKSAAAGGGGRWVHVPGCCAPLSLLPALVV